MLLLAPWLFGETQLVPEQSFRNSFLLLTPAILWNIALTRYLPMDELFPGQAPRVVLWSEAATRVFAFVFPLFLSHSPDADWYGAGLTLYLSGTAVYFASWLAVMRLPVETLRAKALLRYAPAYTPLLIFLGIAAMSESPWYALGSVVFIALHITEYVMRER